MTKKRIYTDKQRLELFCIVKFEMKRCQKKYDMKKLLLRKSRRFYYTWRRNMTGLYDLINLMLDISSQ